MVNHDPKLGTIITGGPAYPLVKGHVGTVEAVRIDGRRLTHIGSLASARALGDAQEVDPVSYTHLTLPTILRV